MIDWRVLAREGSRFSTASRKVGERCRTTGSARERASGRRRMNHDRLRELEAQRSRISEPKEIDLDAIALARGRCQLSARLDNAKRPSSARNAERHSVNSRSMPERRRCSWHELGLGITTEAEFSSVAKRRPATFGEDALNPNASGQFCVRSDLAGFMTSRGCGR